MSIYAILRRSGWRSGGDLEQAAERSRQVGDEQMADDIRWIRSYVLEEGGGSVGTVCIYHATSLKPSTNTLRVPNSPWTRSSRSPTPCWCDLIRNSA